MSVSLPDLIDPRKAAAQTAVFAGELDLSRFARLAALLWRDDPVRPVLVAEPEAEADETVYYRLAFGRDEDGRAVVIGRVAACLPLRCQRCFERYELQVDTSVSLALVSGVDEANALPERYDPLLVDDRLLRPSDLVEDELILAVPTIPRHPESHCQPPAMAAPDRTSGADEPSTTDDQLHPFAALAALKAHRDADA